MSNVIITTSGTSFLATAGSSGPYIPLKYFLLAYDHRFDHNVTPAATLIPVSAGDFTSAVNMVGDIIYNLDGLSSSAYSMSNNEMLMYYPGQNGTTTVNGNPFDSTSYITLRNGVPLSHAISGTSLTYNSPNWNVTGYTLVTGNSAVPTGYSDSARGRFFRTTSYAPISSAAGGNSRGVWKIRLGNQYGTFKFNKIGLYAARILADGTEDTSVAPVLFAIVNLIDPIIKSSDTSNVAYFELDLELEISSNNTFGQYSFLANNSWNYIAGQQAVWFDGRVAISTSGVPNSWSPRARLHITDDNENAPHVRLANDDSYMDQYLMNTGSTVFQTFKSNLASSRLLLETSGDFGSVNFGKIQLRTDANTAYGNLNFQYYHTVSGSGNTGFDAHYLGNMDALDTYLNGVYVSRYRVNDLAQYGTLTLGYDAITAYVEDSKFLTVHGGALFANGNGILISAAPAGLALSANGYIVASDASFQNVASTTIINGGSLTNAGSIYVTEGILSSPRLTIATSAHFAGSMTVSSAYFAGLVSFANNVSANSQITTRTLYVGTAATIYNTILNGNTSINSTTIINGDLTVNQPSAFTSLLTVSSLNVTNTVSANNGYYEVGRSARLGYWTTFEITNFLHSSNSSTPSYCKYTIIGKTLLVMFEIYAEYTISRDRVAFYMPDGISIETNSDNVEPWTPVSMRIGSQYETGFALYDSTFNRIDIFRSSAASYPVSNTSIRIGGQMAFELV